jgi:hypothetical protein
VKTERHWQVRSREYLQRIDEIDQQIKGNLPDPERHALTRERNQVCRAFAELLANADTGFDPAFFSDDSRVVRTFIQIDGVPPKKARERAKAWLELRGVEWDGAAPALRHEIKTAIERGDDVPPDMFGLYNELTIRIDGPHRHLLEAKKVIDALLDVFESK